MVLRYAGTIGMSCCESMNMKKLILILILLFISEPAIAAQYNCKAIVASGLMYSEVAKKWIPATFNASGRTYVVSPKLQKNTNGGVYVVGEKGVRYICKEKFDQNGFMTCEGFGERFRLNRNNLRYVMTYELGYLDTIDEQNHSDTSQLKVILEIGNCSEF